MKQLMISFLALVVGVSLWNCDQSKSQDPGGSRLENSTVKEDPSSIQIGKDRFREMNLELTSIREQYFGNKITTTGMLDVPPNGRAVISAQIGGYIKNAPLLVGDRVQKGQLLLTVENIEFLELQQNYLEASEQLVFLKSDYERQQELYGEKITSEKSFLKAQSAYRTTLATCLSLEKKLQLLEIDPENVKRGNFTSVAKIYAPISGDITQVYTKTGSYVSPSDEIMEIVNTEHMHLELSIFEKDVMKIKKDQPVYFRLPEANSKQFTGEIHLIGKSINEDRTVKVHAHIDESQQEGMVPGMYAQATIITEPVKGSALDSKAVFESPEGSSVFLLVSENDGYLVFERKRLEPGEADSGLTRVLNESDFEPGARFLRNSNDIPLEELVQ